MMKRHTVTAPAAAVVSGTLALALLLAACASPEPTTTPSPAPSVTRLPTATPSPSPSPTPAPSSSPVDPAPAPEPVPEPDQVATDPPAPVPAPGVVSVTLSYWGYDPARGVAFANGYASTVDGGATCDLVLEKQGTEVVGQGIATPDAATTSCGEIVVPRASLSPGTWSASLRFSSPAATGSTDPVEIVIP